MNSRKKGSFSVDPPSSRLHSSPPSFNDNGMSSGAASFAGFTTSNDPGDMKPLPGDVNTSGGGRAHRHGSMLGSSLGTILCIVYPINTHYQYTLSTY